MQWSIWKTSPGDPIAADTKPADYIIFNNYESQEQYDAVEILTIQLLLRDTRNI